MTGYIVRQISQKFGITFSEDEQVYITMHITGKRRLYGHEHLQVEVTQEALIFINRFLRNIYKSTKIDFFEDEELRISLMNHVVPFLTRVRNNFMIHQDDLDSIKKNYPYAYELVIHGLDGLLPQSRITSAEIAYFTLHIALALEKRELGTDEKFSAIVICSNVENMYVLLSYRLKKELDDYFSGFFFITSEDYHTNHATIENNYDFVLNTTDEVLHSSHNVIHISSRITDSDVQKIRSVVEHAKVSNIILQNIDPELFQILDHVDSKEELLKKQIDQIRKKYPLPDNFMDLVLQREEIDSTEFGSHIAIPHPIVNIPDFSFVSVIKLHHPVMWEKNNVQLVFLINLPDSSQARWFMDTISAFLNEENAAQELLSIEKYEDFQNIIQNHL